MSEEQRFSDWCRGHDEVHQEDGVQVSPALVFAKLFDSSAHFNKGPLEETQVISAANHRITHISNSVAVLIMLLVAP